MYRIRGSDGSAVPGVPRTPENIDPSSLFDGVRIDTLSNRTDSVTRFSGSVSSSQRTTSTSHDHDESEPITDRTHGNSWSANLERPQHADDVDLAVSQTVDAIEHTESGNHVDLVTHGDHGHPSEYLYDALEGRVETDNVEWEYIQQCGWGDT